MKNLIYSIITKKPIGISNSNYWIIEAPNKIVDKLVRKYHYSHKATKNRFLSFIVNDDKGFLSLGYGIKPAQKYTISSLITRGNFCEFDRMWLSNKLSKFAETQVISLLLSYLKQVYKRIKFVITYADGSVNNFGIIYKASNAIILDKVQVDFYIMPDGERIHPVTIWHQTGGRTWSVIKEKYSGIKHITNEFQYRFLYILDKKMKKRFLLQEGIDAFDISEKAIKLNSSDFTDLLV